MKRECAYQLEAGSYPERDISIKIENSLIFLERSKDDIELRETVLKYLKEYFKRNLGENLISSKIEEDIYNEKILSNSIKMKELINNITELVEYYLNTSKKNWTFFEFDTLETDLMNKVARKVLNMLLRDYSNYKISYERFHRIVNLYAKRKPLILTIPTKIEYEDDWKNIILKTIEILKNNIELEEAK